jgi:hypothetical protein
MIAPATGLHNMTTHPDELVQRAVRAYKRFCKRNLVIPQQPCLSSSGLEGSLVFLRNVNGDLACYAWDGRKLRNVELGASTVT